MRLQLRTAGLVLTLCAAAASHAQSTAPPPAAQSAPSAPASTAVPVTATTTLAEYGDNKLTVADWDAFLQGIPERDRFGFAMDQTRINKVINDLLRIRTAASEGRRRGLDKDPLFKVRVEQYAEKLLNEMMMTRMEEEANREFEQKRTAFLERAREQYLVNKARFQTPKEVRASHILVEARSRPSDEALAKIRSIRERAIAGEPFDKLAEANSDDSSVKANKGDLGFFGPGRMDPNFEAAAFALKKPMEISEPVKSAYGWHIIRLEDVKPSRQLTFEEATPELMEVLRGQYVGTRQSHLLSGYYDPAKVKWNEPAIVGLKKNVDPAVYRLPEQLKK